MAYIEDYIEEEEGLGGTGYSEPIQEIIGDTPHWLLRWGISVFFGVLLLFLGLAAWIRMPDVVPGTLVFQNVKQAEEVMAGQGGRLQKLFATENMVVDSGALLGYMESTADHGDILEVSKTIDQLHEELRRGNDQVLTSFAVERSRHLGELQGSFQDFYQQYIAFKAFLNSGISQQKETYLRHEMERIAQLNQGLENQQSLQQQDYALAEKEFDAFGKLYEKRVISEKEYRAEKSKLLNKQLPLENTASAMVSNRSQWSQRQQELLELKNEVAEQRAGFMSKLNRFKSDLDLWKRNYILTARNSGTIVFNQRLRVGGYVEANKPLFYIQQADGEGYRGELLMGQQAFGKVSEGQQVIIRLRAYPYQEFGQLEGRIRYLPSLGYADSLYTAIVELDNGNVTSYKRQIQLKPGLIADAKVITEQRSLLSKLFNNSYSLLKNN